MSNPYIFTEAYPNDVNDLSDYNSEEAYELGVSAGWDAIKSQTINALSIKEVFGSIVVTEYHPEGKWTINFGKYNSKSDIEVEENFAKTLLKIQSELLKAGN